jgi:hypothetical protein
MIIIQVIVYNLKGDPDPKDSLLNFKRCDLGDWMFFMALHIACIIFTAVAIFKCN